MTIKHWHKRVRGSEKWIQARRLRFEVRGKKVLLIGYTSSNCDVEVEVDGETLLGLMAAYVKSKKPAADIRVEDCGSIAWLRPLTDAGHEWLTANVAAESWQWQGGAIASEPRLVADIVDGAEGEGLDVEQEGAA